MTTQEVEVKLDAAIARKHIWNVDYTELKGTIARILNKEVMEGLADFHRGLDQDEDKCKLIWSIRTANTSVMRSYCLNVDSRVPKEWELVREKLASVRPLVEKLAAVKPFIEKGRKPSENPAPERSLDHTGTCGCCNRIVKLNTAGRIWDHGYALGRFNQHMSGWRHGSCFGAGYEPIEVSPTVWDAMIKAAERQRVQTLPSILDNIETWLQVHPSFGMVGFFRSTSSAKTEADAFLATAVHAAGLDHLRVMAPTIAISSLNENEDKI
jgi:hypothetical protein